MVGGSGLRTTQADSSRGPSSSALRVIVVSLALSATAGCVYFNQLYNANRLYSQGVSDLEAGRAGAGQSLLSEAIQKADKIVREKPDSRWADDALRLVVRARILLEQWPEAAEAAVQLLGYANSHRDSVEVAGYLGTAQLYLGDVARADSLLTIALAGVEDDDVRADFYLSRGRARMALRLETEADSDLAAASELRPEWVDPRLDRVRLLVGIGRGDDAAAEVAELLRLPLNDLEQREVLAVVEFLATISPETGIMALAEVGTSDLPRDQRARMVKLRGDMKVEIGLIEEGLADYQLVRDISSQSVAAADADVAVVRMQLRTVTVPEELDGYQATMMRMSRSMAARSSRDVIRIRDTLIRIDFWLESGDIGYLMAAEAVRDELENPVLARTFFLMYADEQPTAFWAPKAILAALDLSDLDSRDPSADELRRRLSEDYADSAYVLALTGESGSEFSYEQLEQGLQTRMERLERQADQEVRNRTTEGGV
jgi:tetratricopeptide (TPR) repeat protein